MAAPRHDSIASTLDQLRETPEVARSLTAEIVVPGNPARFADWPDIHADLLEALRRTGRTRAWSHQSQAVSLALEGRDVAVVTPTASGKSMCYVVPTLDSWLRDEQARSLWLFPTKALAQDQVATLSELVSHLPRAPSAATYDGDTPSGQRRAIREAGQIVVTNPDMLHSGILPHHTAWVRLFQNLRFVVIDELHTYRGMFGSHVGNVIRRLLRLCRFYGTAPVVIACSATIANPGELAERLVERPVDVITESGAPQAERRLWFLNPPTVPGTLGVRRSAVLEARRLVDALLRHNLQTIAFTRSRSSVEILLSYLRRLHETPAGAPGPIRGYRSGYLPLERRAIESGLRDGTVRAVVSTNALELGVDIGHLDAAVLVGYPGTIASTRQQLGRAGRRDTPSLGVFLATDDPLDQFLVRHPQFIVESTPEHARVNPDNLLVMGAHLQAATFELAMEAGEGFGRGPGVPELMECFAADGLVHRSGLRYHWSADAFPAEAISLRRASATNVLIIDTSSSPRGPGQGPQGAWAGSGGGRPGAQGRVIGEVDQFSAPVLVHDDAIYLHEGEQYHVERLDWEEKRAYVHPVAVDHFTMAETRHQIAILERLHEDHDGIWVVTLGEVRVSRLATLYKKVRFFTHETVGAGPITLPEQDLHTTAVWWSMDAASVSGISRRSIDAGISGAARALRVAACLVCMCDSRDLGTHVEVRGQSAPAEMSTPPPPIGPSPVHDVSEFIPGGRPDRGRAPRGPHMGTPTIYLYDSAAGGVGLAESCHAERANLAKLARRVVDDCDCDRGCPACVGPPAGGEDRRAAARSLLDLIVATGVGGT